MLLLTLAALLQLGIDGPVILRGDAVSRFGEYESCLKVQATIAGTFNDKDPREVIRLAEPNCAVEWAAFKKTMLEGSSRSTENIAFVEQFRSLAEGSSASELVASREGSCGTRPGPYACSPSQRYAKRP